jgi:hypothetical protein
MPKVALAQNWTVPTGSKTATVTVMPKTTHATNIPRALQPYTKTEDGTTSQA